MPRIEAIIAIAPTVDDGARWIIRNFGTAPEYGSVHEGMSTRSILLSLGGHEHLSLFAPDPEQPPPTRTRWFGLDNYTGPPRIAGWAVSTTEDAAPGEDVFEFRHRGRFSGQIYLGPPGQTASDPTIPIRVNWGTERSPLHNLPDRGLRLRKLSITCRGPQPYLPDDDRIAVIQGDPALGITIDTPAFGLVTL